MSDNPFASPSDLDGLPPATPGYEPPAKVPTGVTAIGVVCLILGILGSLGSCFGAASFGMLAFMDTLLAQAQVPPGPDLEFQRINSQAAHSVMVPNLIMFGANIIVAVMLIIGSIGLFRGSESGRSFMRTALMAAVAYILLKIGVGVYSHFAMSSALAEGVAAYDGEGADQMEMMLEFSKWSQLAGVIFNVVVAFGFLGFYVWARGYLNKSHVLDYFASKKPAAKY